MRNGELWHHPTFWMWFMAYLTTTFAISATEELGRWTEAGEGGLHILVILPWCATEPTSFAACGMQVGGGHLLHQN